ncbi:hypothetical protein ACHQM5_001204 [Ranunculus cassubicifolius]
MKLVWCPDTASKAYIDTVKSCEAFKGSDVAELVSAMAGGWKPQLIVETWYHGTTITTSVGLAVARRHTSGRHVCVVPDEETRSDYIEQMHEASGISPEVVVGEVEEVMSALVGVDFLVVDCMYKDFTKILKLVKLSDKGAILVCKNSSPRSYSSFRWRNVIDSGSHIVRSAYLPVGNGIQISHVATSKAKIIQEKVASRWIRHMDEVSGEEHVYRRRL